MAKLTSIGPHLLRPLAALFLTLGLARSVAADQLVAIDVLLQPDRTMLAVVEDWNTRLREQFPSGFALDATHVPHVTLLQTYVATAELDEALAAVTITVEKLNVASLQLEAVSLYHIPTKELGLAGIVIAPTPALLTVQQAIIDTLAPYRRQGGDEAAFVPDPSGSRFDPFLFAYVDTFVARQSGANYNPHVTAGVGPLAWLEAREAESFQRFTFGVTGIAVYHLGNFGTAATRLAAF